MPDRDEVTPTERDMAKVEAVIQTAIEEWATIQGGPIADDGQPTLARYITEKLRWLG